MPPRQYRSGSVGRFRRSITSFAAKIRRIRKKLHLTQEEAGLLIGGGPRAFQKYESGDLLPSRGVSNALILLDRDPEALSVLKLPQKAA